MGYLQYLHIDSNLKLGFEIYKGQGSLSLVLNRILAQKAEGSFEWAAILLLRRDDHAGLLDDGYQ